MTRDEVAGMLGNALHSAREIDAGLFIFDSYTFWAGQLAEMEQSKANAESGMEMATRHIEDVLRANCSHPIRESGRCILCGKGC